MKKSKVSVVIPCYNEKDNIEKMHARLIEAFKVIETPYEIIFVNNGSVDGSEEVFQKVLNMDENVMVIHLSRNFGHSQPAYTCGMEHATGDCVVCMDGDLQDPPELIPDMYRKWEEGYDVVYGVRAKRKGNIFKRAAYKLFYRIFRKLSYVEVPVDAGDFALLDRKVVEELNRLPERNRFLRGLRAWVGFKQTGIEFTRAEREGGETSNSLMDNIRWAKMGIFSFSFYPLEFISILAFWTVLIALIGIVVYIVGYIINPGAPQGFSTLIVSILFIGGIQLLCLSIIGEYLGKIFEEVKQRPKYIIKKIDKKNKPE